MHARRFLAALGAMLIGLALPASPAFAQRHGDRGDHQILQARYGTAARNIDVTERLRQLARQGQFQVNNDAFGADPAVGQPKTLRIYARGPGGATRTFEYREWEIVDGSQFSGWSDGRWGQAGGWRGGWGGDMGAGRGGISIISASYGDGRRSSEVTDRVRAMVRNGRLDLQVENDTFGVDPAVDRKKSLLVVYSVNGRQQQVRVPEHGRLSLP